MRPIWKGAIQFGLVTIPTAAYPAISAEEKISFRQLRKSDLSPIRYKRVAEADQKEVPWDDIVKGYEYEKGEFVVFDEEDMKALPLRSAEAIQIQDFVDADQIDPIYFDTPYFLEPAKGGAGAYALLREVLAETGKIGIAKFAMRTREHLAAVKPYGDILALELMHFAHEIRDASQLKVPSEKKLGAREKEMAKMLVDQMTADFEPEKYKDEYAEAFHELLEKKIKAGGKHVAAPKHRAAAATNVVDLVEVLQRSLKEAGKSAKKEHAAKSKKRAHHKHAA
jgi:DNA end-binding protein Ku